ncbi:Thioredoxin superfamily protein [Forsythia ovata]|uniref:glutaredoxin-dependent peroxiredoxin n=1 Tax=Forsythia ovata TaxID=205694 RepID=A0ABD1VM64_9LAMI
MSSGSRFRAHGWRMLRVMFICNHCPFVKHLKKDIVKLSNFYMKKGLAVVAISSNAATTHPQDGPVFMGEEAKIFNYPFPYLYDESQNVARDFGAVCTPEFFLFRKDGRRPFELVYHGQFDDSRPSNNVPVTGRSLLYLNVFLKLKMEFILMQYHPHKRCDDQRIRIHPVLSNRGSNNKGSQKVGYFILITRNKTTRATPNIP